MRRPLFLITFLATLFFTVQSAGAYIIKVDLNTPGSGTGQVTFSATSSNFFPFTGWSGESCLGRLPCLLRDLFSNTTKTVIAGFGEPECNDFVYSEFGECRLDGVRRRTVISASPPGCVGGEPITGQGCFFDPCASAQAYEKVDTSLVDKFQNIIDSVINGDFKEALNKTVDLVTGGTEYLPYVPPEYTGGGAPVDGGNFDVIGKGGQKIGAGGGVVTIPAPNGGKISIPTTDFSSVGEIDSGDTLGPIIVTVPRYKSEPEFDFFTDSNFGKDPSVWCK